MATIKLLKTFILLTFLLNSQMTPALHIELAPLPDDETIAQIVDPQANNDLIATHSVVANQFWNIPLMILVITPNVILMLVMACVYRIIRNLFPQARVWQICCLLLRRTENESDAVEQLASVEIVGEHLPINVLDADLISLESTPWHSAESMV